MRAWSAAAVVDWLLREARLTTDTSALVEAVAARLLRAGAPLWRLRLGFFTLHPQLAAWAYNWKRGEPVQVERIPYGVQRTGAYIGSPAQRMIDSGAQVRVRLDRLAASDHRVLHELARAGGTDYLLLPLHFSDGSRNVLAVATDRARGFGARDLAQFEKLSHALGAVLEVAATRRAAETLLDTYVGHRSGRRILAGLIHRGDADEMQAAIWYADLRDFTALTERLPTPRLLEMLNAYFELVAQAVTPRGGEILRFMGDAMLIVFPAQPLGGIGAACAAALDAAHDALARAGALNADRLRRDCPPIRFGIGLHDGQVAYGNVGAPERLDFTVIGPAVNRAARLETLTKELDVPLLMSQSFAAAAGRPARSLGRHRLRGLDEPVEVFALEEAPAALRTA